MYNLKSRKEIEQLIINKCWEDINFKKRFLESPKKVLEQEFNVKIQDDFTFQIFHEEENTIFFVIPVDPKIYEKKMEEELSKIQIKKSN